MYSLRLIVKSYLDRQGKNVLRFKDKRKEKNLPFVLLPDTKRGLLLDYVRILSDR